MPKKIKTTQVEFKFYITMKVPVPLDSEGDIDDDEMSKINNDILEKIFILADEVDGKITDLECK